MIYKQTVPSIVTWVKRIFVNLYEMCLSGFFLDVFVNITISAHCQLNRGFHSNKNSVVIVPALNYRRGLGLKIPETYFRDNLWLWALKILKTHFQDYNSWPKRSTQLAYFLVGFWGARPFSTYVVAHFLARY